MYLGFGDLLGLLLHNHRSLQCRAGLSTWSTEAICVRRFSNTDMWSAGTIDTKGLSEGTSL
eukprot:UN06927